MLKIVVPETVLGEKFNEETNEFIPITTRRQTLQLEHSLVSLSKWEAKWRKPFLAKGKKTAEEILDYVRCMTLTQNVDPAVYRALTPQLLNEITAYIEASLTATTISKHNARATSNETVTSELIYYWMVAYQIPFECQKWHLSRLLTLINVCSVKNAPPKKMGRHEIIAQNRALNAARRKRFNTKG